MNTFENEFRNRLQGLINEKKNQNGFLKLKLVKNIQECPEGTPIWKSMLDIIEVWDGLIQLEELKNELTDFTDTKVCESRLKEICDLFETFVFPRLDDK